MGSYKKPNVSANQQTALKYHGIYLCIKLFYNKKPAPKLAGHPYIEFPQNAEAKNLNNRSCLI